MPLDLTYKCQQAFQKPKAHLSSVPTLRLPNVSKPFQLWVHEKQGFALEMLTQMIWTIQEPIAYLPKRLDNMVQGWPSCYGP